jgi:hypothetical protein
MPVHRSFAAGLLCLALLMHAGLVQAQRVSDVRGTKHNLSSMPTGAATGTGTVPARTVTSSETQVCVFCHTPHAATTQDQGGAALKSPLWNRKVPAGSTYTRYTSSSLDSETILEGLSSQPGGSSKLCLSCHDGTLAIGNVNVLNGSTSAATTPIPMTGTGPGGVMPGATNTGFTRNIGTDLTNDHPISVTYDQSLVTADGELRAVTAAQKTAESSTNLPSGKTHAVGMRDSGTRPVLPLETTGTSNQGQVQCATCHDPHIRDATETANIKFLRANRFQKAAGPSGTVFNYNNDIICLACHKPGSAWANSAHAVNTATAAYNDTAADRREFPRGTQVWQAACLNCHDTHTVPGARRLLREGTDNTNIPKTGGNPAIEQTCYQCHQKFDNPLTASPSMALNLGTQTVPDIMTDFTAAGSYRMPITSNEQCGGTESHSIGDTATAGSARGLDGKDFVERPALLGAGVAGTCGPTNTRHVECTDCHNPHRVQKGNHAGGRGGTDIRGTANGNNVSNALLGGFGVEPVYPADTRFGKIPTGFTQLCGSGSPPSNCLQVVTKEYQICLKCHSNYAYTDTDDPVGDGTASMYNFSGRPTIGQTGTTPADLPAFLGGNSVNVWPANSKYTNQAMEFWGPDSHKGEANGTAPDPSHGLTGVYASPNHRSWHPVMQPTGRTKLERGSTSVSNFQAKFNTNVGTQTMYCTDCHGNAATASTTTNDVDAGRPWGPHGSTNPFILKGRYNVNSGDELCTKCHSGYSASYSGFREPGGDKGNNLHAYHRSRMSNIRCNNCHVAVPHGWKHKALLADTRTVGNEVGLAAETNVAFTNARGYTKGPYYMNAMLKVTTWRRSGQWNSSDCNGGVGGMKSACQNQ